MRGLSCYTASLHGYLAWEWDACAIIAQTIRLAVRVDLPDGELAFSHHQPSLDLLPDGSCLRYAAAPSPMAALPGVADDLAAHGRVIAVTNSSLLPWSAVRGGRPAPHWVLIDGSDGDRWHVTDMFTALLPVGGEQRPYRGWLDTVPLIEAMTLPARWTPQQGMRNALAFGAAVTVPDGAALWLRRCRERPAALPCAGEWLTTTEEALRHLAGYLAERGGDGERHLDDLWAAAGHHSFAYRYRLREQPGDIAVASALDRWESLPRLLRIAVLSAQRGRPRVGLVRGALDELAQAEAGLALRLRAPARARS